MTTRAIFVVSPQGEWQDSKGSSRGISNQSDLNFLIESRRWSDVIVTSGPTVRANDYSPTQKPLWIISSHPEDFHKLITSGANVFPKSPLSVLLEARNLFQNVLCEFGPQSLNLAISENLIDEFYLSITGSFDPGQITSLLPLIPVSLPLSSAIVFHTTPDLVVFRFILNQ